jgi:hypothetical protein
VNDWGELVFLAALLCPGDAPDSGNSLTYQQAWILQRTCLALELCGPHEGAWEPKWGNFCYARNVIREGRNLPPLGLARGLPSLERCREVYRQTRGQDWWQGPAVYAWNEALGARDERQAWVSRRQALAAIVWWVGWRVLVSGELPDPWAEGARQP